MITIHIIQSLLYEIMGYCFTALWLGWVCGSVWALFRGISRSFSGINPDI